MVPYPPPPSPRTHKFMVDPRWIAPLPRPMKIVLLLRENGQVCEIQVVIAIILLKSYIVMTPPTLEQLLITLGHVSYAAAKRGRIGPQ